MLLIFFAVLFIHSSDSELVFISGKICKVFVVIIFAVYMACTIVSIALLYITISLSPYFGICHSGGVKVVTDSIVKIILYCECIKWHARIIYIML